MANSTIKTRSKAVPFSVTTNMNGGFRIAPPEGYQCVRANEDSGKNILIGSNDYFIALNNSGSNIVTIPNTAVSGTLYYILLGG